MNAQVEPLYTGDSAPPQGARYGIPIPNSAHMSEEEATALITNDVMQIHCTWPVRNHFPKYIGDFYKYLKPRIIGVMTLLRVVKGNEGWVLHGRVYYSDGDRALFKYWTPPTLIVLSTDIERGDPTKGRQVIGLDRLMVSPK